MENKQMPKAIITNKSGVSLHGVAPGAEKVIEVDGHNVPKEIQWRKRVRDSRIDGCVELTSVKDSEKEGSSE